MKSKLHEAIENITSAQKPSPKEQEKLLTLMQQAIKQSEDVNAQLPFKYPMSYIARGNKHSTALHMLAFSKDQELSVEAMTLLIKAGARPEIQDTNIGNTPLLLAIATGNKPLVFALIQEMKNGNDTAKRAFNSADQGVNCNNTPLILALKKNYTDITLALLDAGADPDMPARDNQSPLHWAAFFRNNAVLQKLIEKKACAFVQNDYGFWPHAYYSLPLAYPKNAPKEVTQYGLETDELHFHQHFNPSTRDQIKIVSEIQEYLGTPLQTRENLYSNVDTFLAPERIGNAQRTPQTSAGHFSITRINIDTLEEWYKDRNISWDKKRFLEQLLPNQETLCTRDELKPGLEALRSQLAKTAPSSGPASSFVERTKRSSLDTAMESENIKLLIEATILTKVSVQTLHRTHPALLKDIMTPGSENYSALLNGGVADGTAILEFLKEAFLAVNERE
ncbi:MAG: hypothetical protein K0R63_876 [Rickettsiales bacterium]|jgi:hypothetical protein|nr:hypothetical protein [Rickettsiales bacterium]